MDPRKPTNWSIPRASLSSNSSTSSKSYHSNESIRNYRRASEQFEIEQETKKNQRRLSEGPHSGHFSQSSLSSAASYFSERDRYYNGKKLSRRSNSIGEIHLPKRGSRSSQGSTGSTDSNHSASSLLLTVKNLETFSKIQESQNPSTPSTRSSTRHKSMPECQLKNLPIETLMEHPKECACTTPEISENTPTNTASANSTINGTAIDINDKIFSLTKTKDVDQESVASSTHFTIINGFGTPKRFKDTSICRRSRQITILIVTMTIIFMVAICVTVFLMEMRARKMPRYHQ